jgi:hypothetical protein
MPGPEPAGLSAPGSIAIMPDTSAEREVTRLEGFSDAVFGFAITLLVVSLEVPATYDALLATFRGPPAFAITFALLLLVWHEHHTFFRHFGLQDGLTIWLSGSAPDIAPSTPACACSRRLSPSSATARSRA